MVVMEVKNEPEADLAHLGYQQELKRSFNLFSMIGFSFTVMNSWVALTGTLIIGITSGGPPVMIWSWLAIGVLSYAVAVSMAEMCSAFPTSGGTYAWVAILAPPKWARGLAWATGWFKCIGILAMGAVVNFLATDFILGTVNLNNPSYEIERWHVVLLTYGLAISLALTNVFFTRFLNHISTISILWNVGTFLAVFITMLACTKKKNTASFVFGEFQNDTGFESPGMAVMVGLLQAFLSLCCYDAPCHMTEEMLHPEREAPKSMVWAVFLGVTTGFMFLVATFFCIGDINLVAGTATGVPVIQILFDSTGSLAATSVLSILITGTLVFSGISLSAESSRVLWSFSRDNGLPFSRLLSGINKRTQVPTSAVLLGAAVQMALCSIYYASYEGFSTVISIATFGFYVSYAMTLGVRLWSRFSGRNDIGGEYALGRAGLYYNIIGLAFLVFAIIDVNFPQTWPVTASDMNYCSAGFGVVGLVSLATWVFTGRLHFTGPHMSMLHGAVVNANNALPSTGKEDSTRSKVL